MNMNDFFYFLAELDCPFVEKGLVSQNLKVQEAGWLVNTEKGYKIKIFALFNLITALKVEVEKPSQDSEAFVRFDDVTKALVFRAIQSDKNKQDIT